VATLPGLSDDCLDDAWREIDARADEGGVIQIASSELRSIHEFATVRDAMTLPEYCSRIPDALDVIQRSILERPQPI
jgi:hypothetical protein